MPAFLLHGVPDTHHLWTPLRSHLRRQDVLAPDLPGFDGAPLPAGFEPVKESYVAWLIAELAAVGEPVDLVGHDWGALLAIRVASLRPDLVRTWCVGGAASDPTYTWHEVARLWQTPGVGEQFMAIYTPEAAVPGLIAQGVPEAYAEAAAQRVDAGMKDAILTLYRSATHFMTEWDTDLAGMPPGGLLIWGADDPFMPVAVAERMAARVGARLVSLPETGHWWPVERPAEAAALLERHWQEAPVA